MKKIIFMGRTGAGKTSLMQALKGETITYHKTQYINHYDVVIDTPGEYAENASLGRALALYTYEADVVGLLAGANEQYTLYPPNITMMCNREVIGIVTQIDREDANPALAESWLRNAGCKTVYHVSAVTGEGIPQILEHLREPGDPEILIGKTTKTRKTTLKTTKNKILGQKES